MGLNDFHSFESLDSIEQTVNKSPREHQIISSRYCTTCAELSQFQAYICLGLLRSGKKFWKMKIFPGQGKVREVWFESGKLAKIGKSQGISKFCQN